MVVNDTQVKVYAWYDNEWGYVMRMADLTKMILSQLRDDYQIEQKVIAYLAVTAAYWSFMLTDGALRMLVLHFTPSGFPRFN